MKQVIYADNAATTKLDQNAFESMIPWLTDEYGNASQPYSFVRPAKKALAEAREFIASCINASPEEIYFTSGGTESDNWAIKGSAFIDSDRKRIVTSAIEHHAVLNACKAIEKVGAQVDYIKPDRDGMVTTERLSEVIADNTKLVSVMYSNNEIGTIEPISDLTSLAHQYGAWFHTDAVQAIGHIEIDVKKLGVDMLSASAHKFNGPKGVGFLYVKNGIQLLSHNDGGAQERGMRAGTENVAGIVGMAVALKENCNHIEENSKYISALEDRLMNGIKTLDFIRNGSPNHIPGNVSLSFKYADGEAILHRMDLMRICISTGSACDSVNTQISHVIKAIGVPEDYSRGTIRISLGKHNTMDEVDIIVDSLIRIVRDMQTKEFF